MLGYTEEELKDKSFNKLCHPDEFQECSDLLKRMVDKQIHHLSIERRFIHREGGIVWVDIDKAMIFGKSGTTFAFCYFV